MTFRGSAPPLHGGGGGEGGKWKFGPERWVKEESFPRRLKGKWKVAAKSFLGTQGTEMKFLPPQNKWSEKGISRMQFPPTFELILFRTHGTLAGCRSISRPPCRCGGSCRRGWSRRGTQRRPKWNWHKKIESVRLFEFVWIAHFFARVEELFSWERGAVAGSAGKAAVLAWKMEK